MSRLESTSKFISLILRHQPEAIGLSLDGEGWANVADLIDLTNRHGRQLDFDLLKEVVETNSKKRFSFSDDLSKIRANQGHSINVELNLPLQKPPEILFHGTVEKSLGQKETKELAVMVDTFHPLMLTSDALDIENKDYVMSWAE